MKTLLACVLGLCASIAFAGTQELPEPSLAQITGISNLGSETPNDVTTRTAHQAITGWSADGTQLYAQTTGAWTYGYRGSRVARWCGTLTWTVTFDANGNLNPIGVATYTPGNCSSATNSSETFYNAFGYGANAAPQQPFGDWSGPIDIATLLTP